MVITSLPSVKTCVKRQYLASLKRLRFGCKHKLVTVIRRCVLEFVPWKSPDGFREVMHPRVGTRPEETVWGPGACHWDRDALGEGTELMHLTCHNGLSLSFTCYIFTSLGKEHIWMCFFFFSMFLVSKYGLDLNGR